MARTHLLMAEDFRELVDVVGLDTLMDLMIERLEDRFGKFQSAGYVVPVRAGFHYASPRPGLLEWMPVMEQGRRAALKLVGYHPENPDAYNLPTILSTIALMDVKTGHMEAIVDGTFLTALRTGAASAVASRLFANPQSSTLGLIGVGAQAVTQFHALSRLFPIKRVLINDPSKEAIESFPRRAASFADDDIEIIEFSAQTIISEADIVCTCTSIGVGEGPLFDDCDTRPWLHVNAVGADFPGKHELPEAFLKRCLVVPDFTEQACKEGECQNLETTDIGPDLATMVRSQGGNLDGRNRRTVFDSTGYALEDLAAAELAIELAAKHSIGSSIQLAPIAGDPLDPYQLVQSVADTRSLKIESI